jgi:hypothetical protein
MGKTKRPYLPLEKPLLPWHPASLEPASTTPKKKRAPEYSRDLAAKVRAIRKEDPTYSEKKTRPIPLRSMDEADVPSVSTLNRLISREGLFSRPDTRLHRKRSKAALIILNDNGGENMGKAEEYLSSPHINQYWTRPYTT